MIDEERDDAASRNAPVRAVVFDFGGVLITPITNQIGTVARSLGADPAVMKEVLLGPRESGDHPWHRAERGEIPVAAIQQGLGPWADDAGIGLNGDEIERLLAHGQYSVIDEMLDRIASLRADGLLTGLLTNTFAEFHPTLRRDIPLDRFDVVIESYAVGVRKPEPAIYEATGAALAVAPAEIVYLDDFDQNLEPAIALGWRTIHVADPLAALDRLEAVLAEG